MEISTQEQLRVQLSIQSGEENALKMEVRECSPIAGGE